MMVRLLLLFLIIATPLPGDAEQEITAVISNLATALSEGKPPLFLGAVDHDMPGYQQLRKDLEALTADTLISCSIELISNAGSDSEYAADLDWYMVLRSQQDENLIERRRTKVVVKMEKRGRKWVITSFSPVSIFAPMKSP